MKGPNYPYPKGQVTEERRREGQKGQVNSSPLERELERMQNRLLHTPLNDWVVRFDVIIFLGPCLIMIILLGPSFWGHAYYK